VDVLPIVDISDTTMAASGTTKKITSNQILGAGGTATLASATITGDLTVDTSTLKVDSTNNRVGIGTASPAVGAVLGVLGATSVSASAYIASSTWAARFIGSSNGASSGISFLTNSSGGFPTPASIHATPIADYRSALVLTYSADSGGAGYFSVNRSSPIGANTLEHYKIDNDGVATWSNVGGVAGTAMTLNSTGLGVGVASPTFNIHARGTTDGRIQVEGASGYGMVFIQASSGNTAQLQLNSNGGSGRRFVVGSNSSGQFLIGDETAVVTRLTIDSAGNVGVGVTPSAWSSAFKAIQFAANGSLAGQGTDTIILGSNSFINSSSVYKYLVSSRAANYAQAAGSHIWYYDSGTQTAGADVNFVPAMTLDGSGNLILLSSNTPATLATNGQLTVNATSNTNLRFSYRGSDGTTRVANITLA
jgi:hypothetical protein